MKHANRTSELRGGESGKGYGGRVKGKVKDLSKPDDSLFPFTHSPFTPCYSTIHVSPLLSSFSRLPGPDFAMAASIWSTIISS